MGQCSCISISSTDVPNVIQVYLMQCAGSASVPIMGQCTCTSSQTDTGRLPASVTEQWPQREVCVHNYCRTDGSLAGHWL
jgi:hypothetical protein